MNFLENQERVQERDTVILCRGYEKMFPVEVKRGEVVQIKGGAVHHDSLIGKQYGSKVETSNGKNWVLVLHPTPELWTLCLPHRTQIIYSTDTSFITLSLGLRPGTKVIESGTGSGALSHAIARLVAPNGHLHSFEFHSQRAKVAREEFEKHGLGGIITLTCLDVCSEGFDLEDWADAVFLDLPKPWETIESARTALKREGGRFCSFSPCMEQVQRTCDKLHACGFSDVEVVECVHRPFEVKTHVLIVPDVGVQLVKEDVGGAYSGRKLVSPSLGHASLWTAQPTNIIPGHTGYLTSATLHHKTVIN